ncbi:MAG: hypothetical protein JNL67_05270 [Planctomycetaceae bacterium]|nr:hypothetical protein [Planctomycetaceae bacterium]
MDFQKRLHDAIQRGSDRASGKKNGDADELTPEKLKNLHNRYRLELSTYIEGVARQVIDQLPGFNLETLFGEKGWGAAISRDDLMLTRKQRENHYSRLEIFVRPMNDYYLVDLVSKATIRNREIWTRNVYHPLTEVNLATLREQVDLWAVQFAELYSAS